MSFSASRLLHERTADAISRASRSLAPPLFSSRDSAAHSSFAWRIIGALPARRPPPACAPAAPGVPAAGGGPDMTPPAAPRPAARPACRCRRGAWLEAATCRHRPLRPDSAPPTLLQISSDTQITKQNNIRPHSASHAAHLRDPAAFVVHKGLFPQPAILLCACAQRQLRASRSSIGSAARPPARGPVHPVRSHLHRVHLAAYRLRVPALFGRET
jgi:hypothetical protein